MRFVFGLLTYPEDPSARLYERLDRQQSNASNLPAEHLLALAPSGSGRCCTPACYLIFHQLFTSQTRSNLHIRGNLAWSQSIQSSIGQETRARIKILDETNDKATKHLKARPSSRWIHDANSCIGTERLQSCFFFLATRMKRLAIYSMSQFNRGTAHFAALPRRDLLRPVSTISSSSSCFTGSSLTDAAEGSSSSSAEDSSEDTSRLTCLADLGVRFCCSAYETAKDTEQGEWSSSRDRPGGGWFERRKGAHRESNTQWRRSGQGRIFAIRGKWRKLDGDQLSQSATAARSRRTSFTHPFATIQGSRSRCGYRFAFRGGFLEWGQGVGRSRAVRTGISRLTGLASSSTAGTTVSSSDFLTVVRPFFPLFAPDFTGITVLIAGFGFSVASEPELGSDSSDSASDDDEEEASLSAF